MQTSNRLLDDLARVATGAAGALSGVRQEIEQIVRARMERFLADLDLVTREEFEAVEAMASKARSEQEKLEQRVAALEAQLKKAAPEEDDTPQAGQHNRPNFRHRSVLWLPNAGGLADRRKSCLPGWTHVWQSRCCGCPAGQ